MTPVAYPPGPYGTATEGDVSADGSLNGARMMAPAIRSRRWSAPVEATALDQAVGGQSAIGVSSVHWRGRRANRPPPTMSVTVSVPTRARFRTWMVQRDVPVDRAVLRRTRR
jgi:hypothetical protein